MLFSADFKANFLNSLLNIDRVAGINDHITTCVSKVNSVRGITKATTIFSSARFPGPRYPRDFRSLYFDRLSPVDPAYPEPEDDKFYSLAEHNESVRLCVMILISTGFLKSGPRR